MNNRCIYFRVYSETRAISIFKCCTKSEIDRILFPDSFENYAFENNLAMEICFVFMPLHVKTVYLIWTLLCYNKLKLSLRSFERQKYS